MRTNSEYTPKYHRANLNKIHDEFFVYVIAMLIYTNVFIINITYTTGTIYNEVEMYSGIIED